MSAARRSRSKARDARRNLNLKERQMLAHFAKHADLLDVVTESGVYEPPQRSIWIEAGRYEYDLLCPEPSRWLLIPMTEKMLDLLAALEADLDDLEEDDPAEDDGASNEPSLGSSDDQIDQTEWADGCTSAIEPDCEADDTDAEDEDLEPNITGPERACWSEGGSELMTLTEWRATL